MKRSALNTARSIITKTTPMASIQWRLHPKHWTDKTHLNDKTWQEKYQAPAFGAGSVVEWETDHQSEPNLFEFRAVPAGKNPVNPVNPVKTRKPAHDLQLAAA